MKPKSRGPEQGDLLRPRLTDMIDMRHELVKLSALIDWEFFEREWAGFFPSHTRRPATSPRLVAGLLYLQHTFRLSRCALKGTLGDALHAVLCGSGHNIRMILAHLRALWAKILAVFYTIFGT